MLYACACSLTEEAKTTGLLSSDQVSHFPNGDKRHEMASTAFYPKFENHAGEGVYIRKTYQYSKNKISQIIQNLNDNNAFVVKHSDSCNLYLELYFDKDLNKKTACLNKFPVPAFWEEKVFLGIQESKYLPDDFDLYIIEIKQGIFIGEIQRNDEDDLFGYPEWRNGLSKGVAISEERRICIYWTEIW